VPAGTRGANRTAGASFVEKFRASGLRRPVENDERFHSQLDPVSLGLVRTGERFFK
jgi:hypothetical protein